MNRLVLGLFLMLPVTVNAAEIRMYTIDKFDRQDTVNLWGRQARPGCHNLRSAEDIVRVAVIGKGACAIYAEKDCNPESKIAARWKNRDHPTTLLTPGARWEFGKHEKTVTIEAEVEKAPVAGLTPAEVVGKPHKGEEMLERNIIDTGTEEKVTEPRDVEISIAHTAGVRSWQCVESY